MIIRYDKTIKSNELKSNNDDIDKINIFIGTFKKNLLKMLKKKTDSNEF